MIRLIASDMDGTLLNNKHTICEENLKAIRYAEEKGVQFVISTGRNYDSVKPILDELDLKCECIVMSGAEYRDEEGNVLDKITMKKDNIKAIVEIFKGANFPVEMITSEGLYVANHKYLEESLKDRREMICQRMSDDERETFEKQFRSVFSPNLVDNIDEFLASDIEVYKIMTFNKNADLIADIKQELSKKEDLAVASTFSNDIEITDRKAQKGLILAQVIEKKGLNRDEVMVLGDSFNDYSMFTEFKHSFAMENAIPEIKEIATYITDSNDRSGVAKAIYKMIGEI